MEEGEALLHELFEAADIGLVMVGRDLRVLAANRAVVAAMGGDPKGRLVADAFPHLAPTLLRVLRSVLETEASVRAMELRAERTPGRITYIVASFWPLRRDGKVVAIGMRFANATARRTQELEQHAAEEAQRRAAEDAQRENALRFRQLAENIGSAFWLLTADRQTLLYVSPAFEEVWGISVAEALTGPAAIIAAVHPEDRPRVLERASTPFAAAWQTELRVIKPGGEVAWLDVRSFPVHDERGVVVRAACIATDITRQRELETQLLQAQKLDSLGRIAGGIAHDFNNLLTVVLNQATMASRIAQAGGTPREELAIIKDAARQGAQVTRQLLSFAKRQALVPAPLVPNDLVDSVLAFLRRLIGDEIALVLDLEPDIGVASVDWAQLEQVLVNLALNARDAMPGGGTLTIRTKNVSVAPAALEPPVPPGEWVVLAVSDTGRGISDADRPRIFEPFFSTKPGSEGTGLGLATCYGVVKQHGGHVLVDTALGAGTTFTLYFPRTT